MTLPKLPTDVSPDRLFSEYREEQPQNTSGATVTTDTFDSGSISIDVE